MGSGREAARVGQQSELRWPGVAGRSFAGVVSFNPGTGDPQRCLPPFSSSSVKSVFIHATVARCPLPCPMMSWSTGLRVLEIVLVLWVVRSIARIVRLRRAVGTLPGPNASSWIWGCSWNLHTSAPGVLLRQWANQYGGVVCSPGPFGVRLPSHLLISPDDANPHQGYLLSITDRTAASHILSTHTHQSGTYPKPPGVRAFFDILVGRGVIWAEGHQHTRQRRTLAPAFAIGALREMTEVFVDCAAKAAKRWEEMLTGSEKGMVTVDVQAWANHISYVPCVAGRELLTAYRLDSIGLAGFSHDFETLTATQKTPLAAALDAFTDSTATTSFTMFAIKTLTMRMPWVFKLPSQRNKTIQEARRMLGEATKSIWADLKSSEGQDAGKTILGVLRELRNCRWVRCSMCGRSGWSEPEPFGRRDCGRGVFSR